jgi:hypothetical protein
MKEAVAKVAAFFDDRDVRFQNRLKRCASADRKQTSRKTGNAVWVFIGFLETTTPATQKN